MIKRVIRDLWRYPLCVYMRSQLKNRNFSIISSNCIGGVLSHDLGQEYRGYEFLQVRYMRAHQYIEGKSFGTPQYEGDVWSKNYTKLQFIELGEIAKYCYLMNVNQYFQDKYGELFKPELKQKRLYKFDNEYFHLLPLNKFELDFKKLSMLNIEHSNKANVTYNAKLQKMKIRLLPDGTVTLKLINDLPVYDENLKRITLKLHNPDNCNIDLLINKQLIKDIDKSEINNDIIKIDIPYNKLRNLSFIISNHLDTESSLSIFNISLEFSEFELLDESINYKEFTWKDLPLVPYTSGTVEADGRIKVYGNGGTIIGNKLIKYNPEKSYKLSANISNIENTGSKVILGFALYDEYMRDIFAKNVMYVDNTDTVLVDDVSSNDSFILVKDATKWTNKNCLAIHTKDDFSDLPNFNIVENKIVKIEEILKETWKITFSNPIGLELASGTQIRQHERGVFLYFCSKSINPKMENIIVAGSDSTINNLEKRMIGVKYMTPILISLSLENGKDNGIELNSFSFESILQ